MMNRIPLALLVISACTSCLNLAHSKDDLRIWNEFINALRSGTMSIEKIRPHKQLGDECKSGLIAATVSTLVMIWAAVVVVLYKSTNLSSKERDAL